MIDEVQPQCASVPYLDVLGECGEDLRALEVADNVVVQVAVGRLVQSPSVLAAEPVPQA